MNYSFDINKLIRQLLPPFLAKARMIAWLEVLLVPLNTTRIAFVAFVQQKRYQLTITSQVNRLERALRDRFESELITVESSSVNQDAIYSVEESQNQLFCIFTNAEAERGSAIYTIDEELIPFDFVIYVPAALAGKADEIKAFVKYYAIAGKSFVIKYI